MTALRRAVVAFGRFWWGFLIGDTPEIFCAVVAIVCLALVLRHDRVAAVVLLPVLAVAVLAASTFRGRRRRSAPGAEGDG